MQNETTFGYTRSLCRNRLPGKLAARKDGRTCIGITETGSLKSGYFSSEEEGTGTVHIYPLRDVYEHFITGLICGCHPEVDWEGLDMVVYHNSFDFREAFENLDD